MNAQRDRRLGALKGLAVNRRQRVFQLANIQKSFSTEPGCVLPAEAFSKGIIRCSYVPVTIHVGSIDRALRPIGLPLRHLDPHHGCKNQGEKGIQHVL